MNQEEIITAVKEAFKRTSSALGNFQEILSGWIHKDSIVAFQIDQKNHRVFILTSSEKYGDESATYRLLRIFPVRDKWEISVDYSGQSSEEMMGKLLKEMVS